MKTAVKQSVETPETVPCKLCKLPSSAPLMERVLVMRDCIKQNGIESHIKPTKTKGRA